MAKVHQLPPEVISKIAAGEVIERPASVVKELMENSVDAGAERVEVEIKSAGKELISVRDDGCGIGPEDMDNVFQRHSTSKIAKAEDIYMVGSLGFRGEALYSIASVSDVLLQSRTRDNDAGWEIHLRGNKRLKSAPAGVSYGTTLEIRELFFNTPARRKFLKSDTTETNEIIDVFMPYALLYPGKEFKLVSNGKVLLELEKHDSHRQRMAAALNLESKNLIETEKIFPQERLNIHLVLGNINLQRKRRDMQFIFVNGRPVSSKDISFHVNQAYRLLMPDGVNPIFSVHLRLPQENIDVNVHPAKREIRIKDERNIFLLLRNCCEHALMNISPARQFGQQISSFHFNGEPPHSPGVNTPHPRASGEKEDRTAESGKPYRVRSEFPFPSGGRPPAMERQNVFSQEESAMLLRKEEIAAEKNEDLKSTLKSARFIGSLKKKYLLFESTASLLLIDQHAAQERITYEKLSRQMATGKVEIQNLLAPLTIRLNKKEILAWEILKEKLEKIGFSTTLFDKETVAVHSHPALLAQPEAAVRDILCDEESKIYDTDMLARRACRQSLMTGYDMKAQEAEYLAEELLKCADPFTCPHGRPTVVEITMLSLDKNFFRRL
ncbi:MAG: DNA mismatch repair endonuclease MutL [Elusimicrobia bacterium]|nr:DNA mismatch repair endonuclease MutL [Elusimicrobiota bacterium]